MVKEDSSKNEKSINHSYMKMQRGEDERQKKKLVVSFGRVIRLGESGAGHMGRVPQMKAKRE